MTSSAPDDRRAKALELHLAGASYQTIADQLGYASKASAHKIVQQALDELGTPDVSEGGASTELARLDAMLTGLWPKARRGDVAAVDRVLKISERRAAIQAMTESGRRRIADEEAGSSGALGRLRGIAGGKTA